MTATTDAPPPKKSKAPLLIGLILALVGAGAGFFLVTAGILFGAPAAEEHAAPDDSHGAPAHGDAEPALAVAFVPLDPLVITLPGNQKFLRFTAQVEVAPDQKPAVEAIVPRIVDVLNSYLRAVSLEELADPAALLRLRAQMLRRVQVVAGPDKVRDLLIMEFVIN